MVLLLSFVVYLWRNNWKGLLLCCVAVLIGVLFGARDKLGVNTREVLMIGVITPVILYLIFKRYSKK
jgi:uncharacterized membrane protein YfcA